ncbi:MAG: DUF3800 domain-containing protein, partial [Actinobacteria bacterium]
MSGESLRIAPAVADVSASVSDWLHLFVDESGTFDYQPDSRYFIAAAVLVPGASLAETSAELDRIAGALGGGAEIKSSRIGRRHELRLKYLTAVQPLDFSYACLIVDKKTIGPAGGLKYKSSFQKYFKNLLQRTLENYAGPGLRVVFDEYGSRDFMVGFEEYMRRRVQPSLWFEYSVQHESSGKSRLIQLADLVAGSLAYCFEPTKRSDHSAAFRSMLESKEFSAVAWPPSSRIPVELSAHHSDPQLWKAGVIRARRLISQLARSQTPDDHVASACLEQLLMRRTMETGSRESIHGERLVQVLQDTGHSGVSLQSVRDAVATLRD